MERPNYLDEVPEPLKGIASQLTEDEFGAFNVGLNNWMDTRKSDLEALEIRFPNMAGRLIHGFETSLRSPRIRQKLLDERDKGTSEEWLAREVERGLTEAVQIAELLQRHGLIK